MTLQAPENLNLSELDIDNMPIILEDSISISENITIENDNNYCHENFISDDENQSDKTITINDEHYSQKLYPHDKENIKSKQSHNDEKIQHKKEVLKRKNEIKDFKFKDHDRNTLKTGHDTESENPPNPKIKKSKHFIECTSYKYNK